MLLYFFLNSLGNVFRRNFKKLKTSEGTFGILNSPGVMQGICYQVATWPGTNSPGGTAARGIWIKDFSNLFLIEIAELLSLCFKVGAFYILLCPP